MNAATPRKIRHLLAAYAVSIAGVCSTTVLAAGPEVPVSKETTYVVGPIRDGEVDFKAAIDAKSREGVTAENNAFVPIARSVGAQIVEIEYRTDFFERLGIALPPEQGGMVTWDEFTKDRDTNLLTEQFWRANLPWSEAECPEVAEWLRRNSEALNRIEEAAKRTRFYVPHVGDGPVERASRWGLPYIREAARLLRARAMLRLNANDVDASRSDLLACHRLARVVATSPLPGYRLVALAVEGVACHGDSALAHDANVTPEEFHKWRKELAQLGPLPEMSDSFAFTARLEFLDLLQNLREGDVDLFLAEYRFIWAMQEAFEGNGEQTRTLVETTLRQPIDWAEAFRSGNRWYDRFAEAIQLESVRDSQAAFQDLERRIGEVLAEPAKEFAVRELSEPARNARLLVAAFAASGVVTGDQFAKGSTRIRQQYDLALIALALAEYRSRHGRYPDRLDQLVPDLVSELPSDRFTAGLLHYRASRDGETALTYSVGLDGRDNGGEMAVGGDDVSLRLPPTP